MNKFINRISTFTITVLIVLAIFQINRLWFEEGLNRNFFYILSSRSTPSYNTEYYEYFTMPKSIVTGFGNNQFNISYSSIDKNSTRAVGDKVLNALARNGQFDNVYPVDYDVLLRNRSIIYEYAFTMDSVVFNEVYPSRNNVITRAPQFDAIYMIPDENASSIIHVFFVDAGDELMYGFVLDDIDLADSLQEEIRNIQRSPQNNEFYYVSSKLLKLNIDKNVFFPKWKNDGFVPYFPVQVTTSYYELGDLTMPNLRKNISFLFDSPSAVWESYDINGKFTFSDANTVVKYFENDILDYTNYRINQQNKGASLLDDFAQVMSFIKRDNMMNNDIYFAGYEEVGSIRTFYFNYVENNVPILLSGAFNEIGVKYGIEVTLIDGTLTKYRKLSYDFEIDYNTIKYANLDILSLIDDMEVGDINFGYRLPILERTDIMKELGLSIIILDNNNTEVYSASVTTNSIEPEL